jgi:hypothetical protein
MNMSFILDALKKSEHKRRAQAGEESVTLYQGNDKKIAQRRQSIIIVMIFLLLGIFLLLAVLVWQRPWMGRDNPELPVALATNPPATVPARQGVAANNPAPALTAQPQVEIPAGVVPPQEQAERPLQSPIDSAPDPDVGGQTRLPVVTQSTPTTAEVLPGEPVAMVNAELAEDRVYSISDLPVDVRRRLPALQMALHAYNAADADASLVQVNGRLVREGAQIAENLIVDEITGDGAILRSGIYRFLLPRRGQ